MIFYIFVIFFSFYNIFMINGYSTSENYSTNLSELNDIFKLKCIKKNTIQKLRIQRVKSYIESELFHCLFYS